MDSLNEVHWGRHRYAINLYVTFRVSRLSRSISHLILAVNALDIQTVTLSS
jgi:hypothetical protein